MSPPNEPNIFPEFANHQLRQAKLEQKGRVFWFFGPSGSGKSTLVRACDEDLLSRGYKTVWLDGDTFRSGVSRDLGFSAEDRTENLRRAAEVAKILIENQIIVFCSFIAPLFDHRAVIKKILGENLDFIFVKASEQTCQSRDTKGLYRQNKAIGLNDFDLPLPRQVELELDTDKFAADILKQQFLNFFDLKNLRR